ncbi:LAS21 [Candida margitis]|uniref:LAS21 n=1 Tax=Candida margitis TaxID=1775924 RepID=UPI002225C532|nr:LAS21 [Candida margitis]KAI5970473.1 LAS21 [Candida margitis]
MISLRWQVYSLLAITNIVGFTLFLCGFFPSKVVLPGNNTFLQQNLNFESPFLKQNGKPQFERLILMVVDAMRADFCFSEGSNFNFLHDLINDGHAIPFTAFSNPPTVTLPRLKGITTGGTPSFLDAILNVADDYDDSQGLHAQDSWVHQFKSLNKSINFFGDDTWLKLFPQEFGEFEGTNSFFVSDFTEVDNNVTRHLDSQLSTSKWDGLILHYLGLDHIGHKGGPSSTFMKPKQAEMDSVLKRLYKYTEQHQDTLIVVMGDHGMNEVGNHGGSSAGETSAALAFVSSKFNSINAKAPLPVSSDYTYYDRLYQIDLVPTLASLFSFPIPKNSLGVITRKMIELWPENQRQKIILENCFQIMSLYEAKNGPTGSIWQRWKNLQNGHHAVGEYYSFLEKVQLELASSATNYNYKYIYAGAGMIILATLVTALIFNFYFFSVREIAPYSIIAFEAFALIYSIHFHGSSLIEEEHQIWYFASSLATLAFGLFYFKVFENKSKLQWFVLLISSSRMLKSWNNSGQKWFSDGNIANYLFNYNQNILWLLIVVTYGAVAVSICLQGNLSWLFEAFKTRKAPNLSIEAALFNICALVAISVSFSFKLVSYFIDGNMPPGIFKLILLWVLESQDVDTGHLDIEDLSVKFQLQHVSVHLAKYATFATAAALVLVLISRRIQRRYSGTITDITNILTLYLVHQTKHANIPMFLVLLTAKLALAKLVYQISTNERKFVIDNHIICITFITLCLQNLSFFTMGNTNSLATVDLSNSYNGVQAYDVFLVGLLTFISNFAGPIYWSLSSLQLIFEPGVASFKGSSPTDLTSYPRLKYRILLTKSFITLLFYTIAATNLVASCINLRFHLFVWTVFSPKLLFFASWLLLVNGLVDLIGAGLLLTL